MSIPEGVLRQTVPLLQELQHMAVYEAGPQSQRRLLYGPGDASARMHIDMDAERLAYVTSLVLDGAPQNRPLSVLDLGANPYLLTYVLMREGAAVTTSGHPLSGEAGGSDPFAERVEFCTSEGTPLHTAPLSRFNVELDPFPFPNESFDVVVCGELIEHLIHGPHQMLQECNRVLVPGGRLILSTPNAVSLSRAVSIARGVNFEWPYSPQGVYARHNRTYTLSELRDLLTGNHLRPYFERGVTTVYRRHWFRPGMPGLVKWVVLASVQRVVAAWPYRLTRFADGILIAARKEGEPRLYQPGWLYGAADSVPMVAAAPGAA